MSYKYKYKYKYKYLYFASIFKTKNTSRELLIDSYIQYLQKQKLFTNRKTLRQVIGMPIMPSAVINDVNLALSELYVTRWQEQVNREDSIRGTGHNKLRTYCTFKQSFSTEPYLKLLNKSHRSECSYKVSMWDGPNTYRNWPLWTISPEW